MSYSKDLDEYTDRQLREELARREAAVTQGICDYCGRGGLVEPACKFPERHNRAGMQQQRLNRIAAGIPQVGVTEVRFHRQPEKPCTIHTNPMTGLGAEGTSSKAYPGAP